MKKLLLCSGMLLLCYMSSAQTKDSLTKLYDQMVKVDKQWRKANQNAFAQTGDNWRENTPKEDSINRWLEDEHVRVHDEYNAYWLLYHEKKGDGAKKISKRYYGPWPIAVKR